MATLPPEISYDDAEARLLVNQLIIDNNSNAIKPIHVRTVATKILDVFGGNFNAALDWMLTAIAETSAQSQQAQAANTAAQALVPIFQALIAQGYTVKGNWTIATNTPNLGAISKASGDVYIVVADGTTSITGTSIDMKKGDAVQWNGTAWIHRPNATIPADGSVTALKLIGWMADMFTQLPDDSPYKLVVMDSMNRLAFAIAKDGWITGKFVIEAVNMMVGSVATAALQNASVTLAKLAADVLAQLIQSFDVTDRDYWFLITDAMNRIGFGIRKDGTIIAKIETLDNSLSGAKITDGTLTAAKFTTDLAALITPLSFQRLNSANANDVEVDLDDDMHEVVFTVPAKTPANGFNYVRFAAFKTRALRGLNSTGTSLQFRQSNRMNIKGRRYRGTFNPSASGVLGTNYRGVYGNSYTNSYPAFTAGSIGDCWAANVANTPGATVTANGLTFKNGDLIVQTGASTYAVQPGPGDGSFVEGDFWNVTNTSAFGKIQLTANQRILFVGIQSQSGPKYVQFLASKAGEFYIMGECNPATFDAAVTTQNDGDLYICSASGTAKTLAVLEGDSIAYEGGWFVAPGLAKTFASGAMVFLPCSNASEWEVRRTDKSTAQVIINLSGAKSVLRRRVSDSIRLLSDSMFGNGGVATKIIALAATKGRAGTYRSDGGATSEDILSMLKMDTREGDTYAGQTYFIWHGQNNDSSNIEMAQTCAMNMASILGAHQKRFIFWSILGSRALTYNGTRMVATIQEGAFAGSNFIANLEKWYELAFPKQWWSPRKALLDASVTRTTPDPNFPGLTEAQVAATYGILPFSFFFDYATKPFTAAQLVYDGDWTSGALPVAAGTVHHYYRRTGGGTIGNIIAYEGGIWVEYAADVIHMTAAGGDVLSVKFNDFLNSINL